MTSIGNEEVDKRYEYIRRGRISTHYSGGAVALPEVECDRRQVNFSKRMNDFPICTNVEHLPRPQPPRLQLLIHLLCLRNVRRDHLHRHDR